MLGERSLSRLEVDGTVGQRYVVGVRTIGNVLWLLFAGIWLALGYLSCGLLLFVTVIGIPFGFQAK